MTNFKEGIDQLKFRGCSNISVHSAGAGFAYCECNDNNRPIAYNLVSATNLFGYDWKKDGITSLGSPALTGTFGAGAGQVAAANSGPTGTITTASSTTSFTLNTALPAAVGINQLANRLDGEGMTIRILNKMAGKTEERKIVANTGGTTPTIYVDRAFSFTPATNDGYEFLTPRIFMLSAGTTAAGCWKYYDACTNSYSGNLATTNLPATLGTDSCFVAFSESYVPYTRKAGEGFRITSGVTYDTAYTDTIKGCLQASAATSTSLTGTAAGGDASLLANQYANFQIRIVEDTVNPTAVGQRRVITSHTTANPAVYTVPAWTVTPSYSAKYVIELDNDKIVMFGQNTTATYTYSKAGNAWDANTTFGAAGGAHAAGCWAEMAFSLEPTTQELASGIRQGQIYVARGGATTIDVLDIGLKTWSNAIVYGNLGQPFATGTCSTKNPATEKGKYVYLNSNGTQNYRRFDMLTRNLEVFTTGVTNNVTAVVGNRMFYAMCGKDTDDNKIPAVFEWRVADSKLVRIDLPY